MGTRDLKDTLEFETTRRSQVITAVRMFFILAVLLCAYFLGVYRGVQLERKKTATVAAADGFTGLTAKNRREIVSRWSN